MVFDDLSNAAYRLFLRRSGVELEGGGRKTAPPPRPAVLQIYPRPGAGFIAGTGGG